MSLELDKNHIIASQVEQIKFLLKENENLRKENKLLKAALTRQTIEAGKSFRDLRDQFDQLAQDLYDLLVHWVSKLQRGLTYDQIINYYRIKHPKTQYTAETICRRIRELAEQGWLHSPERGTFIPVPRETKPDIESEEETYQRITKRG